MNDTEMRIAIAEACGRNGWWCPQCRKLVSEYSLGYQNRHANCTDSALQAPDYLNDLNAIHEAEMVLLVSEQETYTQMLCCLNNKQKIKPTVDGYYFIAVSATARQRAEAFLKAKGLWEGTT